MLWLRARGLGSRGQMGRTESNYWGYVLSPLWATGDSTHHKHPPPKLRQSRTELISYVRIRFYPVRPPFAEHEFLTVRSWLDSIFFNLIEASVNASKKFSDFCLNSDWSELNIPGEGYPSPIRAVRNNNVLIGLKLIHWPQDSTEAVNKNKSW